MWNLVNDHIKTPRSLCNVLIQKIRYKRSENRQIIPSNSTNSIKSPKWRLHSALFWPCWSQHLLLPTLVAHQAAFSSLANRSRAWRAFWPFTPSPASRILIRLIRTSPALSPTPSLSVRAYLIYISDFTDASTRLHWTSLHYRSRFPWSL